MVELTVGVTVWSATGSATGLSITELVQDAPAMPGLVVDGDRGQDLWLVYWGSAGGVGGTPVLFWHRAAELTTDVAQAYRAPAVPLMAVPRAFASAA